MRRYNIPPSGAFIRVPEDPCRRLLIENFELRLDCLNRIAKLANAYFKDQSPDFAQRDVGHITQFMAELVADVILLRREVFDLHLLAVFDAKQMWFFEKHPETVERLIQYYVRHAEQQGDSSRDELFHRWLVHTSLKLWPSRLDPKPQHPHLRLVT